MPFREAPAPTGAPFSDQSDPADPLDQTDPQDRPMPASAPSLTPTSAASFPVPAPARDQGVLISLSGLLSLAAGVLTPFTVSLGGEMPLGELLLFVAAGWALLIMAMAQAWPGPLWRNGVFITFMVGQALALAAYVASDIYRGSAPNDFIRGWARMIFLGVDLAAVAYLVGCNARNFLLLLVGVQLGEVAKVHLEGALFGDYWKFGYALPFTIGVMLLAGRGGVLLAATAAAGLGLAHFVLDFRSLGLICLLVAACLAVQVFPRNLRTVLAPLGLLCGVALGLAVYAQTRSDRDGDRSTRSNVERSAMVIAGLEAFRESPLLGHGSWFSRTKVIDNFMIIREEGARDAGVGGFAGANEIEEDAVALHSQLIVTLAEGGLFGAAFFIPFTIGLFWALHNQIVVSPWSALTPVRVFVLSLALFHVFLSPFSGAHRVGIALAAILVVLIHREHRLAREAAREAAPEAPGPPVSLFAPRTAPGARA